MYYDYEIGCKLITPSDVKNMDLYKKLVRNNDPRTVQAIHRKYHKFIDQLVTKPSIKSQLVWMRLAKLFGRQGEMPHPDICYIEDIVSRTVSGNSFNLLNGTILRCIVAERPEKYWLSAHNDMKMRDPVTGKKMFWTGYWINSSFVPPVKVKTKGFKIEDLCDKFNK